MLLARAEKIEGKALPLDADARAALVRMADGDGRAALTLTEEIEYDAMAIQARELAAELETRRSFERKLNEHVLTLMQKNGNAQ